jgi:hypothetical protein
MICTPAAVICSLDDFRSMKLALGGPRDLIDIAELDELHAARSRNSAVVSSGG